MGAQLQPAVQENFEKKKTTQANYLRMKK